MERRKGSERDFTFEGRVAGGEEEWDERAECGVTVEACAEHCC